MYSRKLPLENKSQEERICKAARRLIFSILSMSRVILQQVRHFLRVLPEASDMGKPFETQAHFSRYWISKDLQSFYNSSAKDERRYTQIAVK